MSAEPVRRCSNGTIDLDFYRQRAMTLRVQAGKPTFRNVDGLLRPLIVTTFLLVIFGTEMASSPAPVNDPVARLSAVVTTID